jgi:hypothetical protein
MTNVATKPLQTLSWKDKIKNDNQWFKDNIKYYLAGSRFGTHDQERDLQLLYDVYNSRFPMNWFTHITDPLSAKNPNHKNFPAKIRPVNILRTNLDLLMAEYPRRPFIFQVNNLSDTSYSSYQEELKKTIKGNLTKMFQLQVEHDLMAEGLITKDGQPASQEVLEEIQQRMSNLPIPEDIKEKFHLSYKDALAVKGQKWLRRCIAEHSIRQKFGKMFKHWVIVGEAYSYKTVEFDTIRYKPVSPKHIDFDKSPDEDYVEDSEWVVYREQLTVSDVVDRYYEVLKKDNITALETNNSNYASPQSFYTYVSEQTQTGKVPVTHVTWKGRKMIKFITIVDPMTGEVIQDTVDEDYVIDKATETVVEEKWVNELYEGTMIGDDIFVNLRPVLFQRNVMNNFSVTKQPYNGRKYSDLHSINTSLTELGLPYLIMYIIVTRTLELTIAKSKGKILLIDQNAIPTEDGWDEEKFFYYSEALGYALMNRNQIGVDKSWNQYQVVDMSLFDQIKQLIELQQHFKNEWDDIIGINRQRKGQTYASDLVGVNERATFQSTIITDMIFNLFEEFTEKELQGLLDLSKFTEIEGTRKLWNSTEFGNEILEIEPDQYCNASFGVMVQSSSEAIAIKNKLEANVQAMIQNNVKTSTIIEVLTSDNVAELKAKIKRVEEIEQEIAQQQQESEAEVMAQQDERRYKLEELLHSFKMEEIEAKGKIEKEKAIIQGEYNTFTFQDGDANDNGILDAKEVEDLRLEREKLQQDASQRSADRQLKREEIASKERIAKARPKPTK